MGAQNSAEKIAAHYGLKGLIHRDVGCSGSANMVFNDGPMDRSA
jgi:hypothetical protein